MKNIFLLILSLFTLSNASAKDDFLFNSCTNERISLEQALFNKSILLNKDIKINKGEFFLISYLDNEGGICYEKKFDLLFKLNNVYLNKKEIVYSREGEPKEIKYNKIDIKNVSFSKLVNNY